MYVQSLKPSPWASGSDGVAMSVRSKSTSCICSAGTNRADAPLALVSVGADNVYGHPAPSTIRLLHQSGAVVRRTDQDGDIAVVSRAGRLAVVTHPP